MAQASAEKTPENLFFVVVVDFIFLLVMPKYEWKQNGVSPKWVKSNEGRKREEERKK